MKTSEQYLTQSRDNFEGYINRMLCLIGTFLNQEHMNIDDRNALEKIKCIVVGKSAEEIKQELNISIVENSLKHDTIKKFRKLNEDIVDIALELVQDKVRKEILKQLCNILIEQDEQTTLLHCSICGVEVK